MGRPQRALSASHGEDHLSIRHVRSLSPAHHGRATPRRRTSSQNR